MDKASEVVLALKPVTFHYKNDTKRRPRFGLIAEQVSEVDPNLVVLDKEGKPYSVQYDQVNAMLLNEFLKEHRKNEAQQRQIEKQQKQVNALAAQLKRQAALIQKVSMRVEVNKAESEAVANN
jgi:hypothetical protein